MNRIPAILFCLLFAANASADLPRPFGKPRTEPAKVKADPPPVDPAPQPAPDPKPATPENVSVTVLTPPEISDFLKWTKEFVAAHTADPTPAPPQPGPPADPPFLRIADVTIAPGELAIIQPQTNCIKVRYVAIDKGLTVFPTKYLNPDFAEDLLALGITPGAYRITAAGMTPGDLVDPVVFTITVAGHGPRPPPDPPQPGPPIPTPPTPTPGIETAQFLGIVIIDDVLRRQPATAAILGDPIWQTLRKAGHKVINYNVTDPAAKAYQTQLTANGGQPVLVITSLATNHWLNKDPADLKMQATAAGVQALVNKYTGK